nr:MAG TPA: hypothetical protein [Caudoviricetes sp.]
MNRENLIFAGIGFLAGVAVTTVVGYFGVYRKYIPLHQLEDEVNRLEERRQSKGRQLDAMDAAYEERKAAYDKDLQDMSDRLDMYDADIADAKKELEDIKPKKGEDKNMMRENLKAFTRFEIHDGNPRWDGPLTDEEQESYDACNGDENLILGLLTEVKEHRFKNSIDPKRPTYMIDDYEHKTAPDFIDTVYLDYYVRDDKLAEGRVLIERPDDLIDMAVLVQFGKYGWQEDPNIVICRNDTFETDYVIERHEESYQESVFGIDPDNITLPSHRVLEDMAKKAYREELNA